MSEMLVAAEPANYDESKVGSHALPNPLLLADGATAESWPGRRGELLELFRVHVYGRSPGAPATIRHEVTQADDGIYGGLGVRRVIKLGLTPDPAGPALDLVLVTPRGKPGAPVFVGLRLFDKDDREPQPGGLWKAPAGLAQPPATPGAQLGRYLVEQGFAFATLTPEDFAPDDKDRFREGLIAALADPGRATPTAEGWGSISAWAWALSRALDYFEADPAVDARRTIVVGHSRMGKTALWAGAQDERFAIVISNNSGCGGAALSRRNFGETVAHINERFPHWFCGNFKNYNGREEELPVDQHELLALIAPRPLYVASASEDGWADPRGEFLAAVAAEPVYRLLGKTGLGVSEMPNVDQSVGETVGYHLRSGEHALTDYDWVQYVAFAKRHFGL